MSISNKEVTSLVRASSYKVLNFLFLTHKENPSLFEWKDNREGMCALASLLLMDQLFKQGLRPVFVTSMCHCFLMLDEKIIDITATQFGNIKEDVIFENYLEFLSKITDDNPYNSHRAEPWEVVCRFDTVGQVLTKLKFKETQFDPKQWAQWSKAIT